MEFEIKKVLKADSITLVNSVDKTEEIDITALNENSRKTLKQLLKCFDKNHNGSLEVAEQKEMYKNEKIQPCLRNKKLTNNKIDKLRITFFAKKGKAGTVVKTTDKKNNPHIKALINCFANEDIYERPIISALLQIGPAAVPALIEALGDPNRNVRAKAAYVLGEMGPAAKEAVPALIKALGDADEDIIHVATIYGSFGTNVGGHAAHALAEIGPAAVPALIEALGDPNRNVRAKVAYALDEMGPTAKAAVPALIKALGIKMKLCATPQPLH